eukprot:2364667-Lingulodinium_polyedra.AAC.1
MAGELARALNVLIRVADDEEQKPLATHLYTASADGVKSMTDFRGHLRENSATTSTGCGR